MPGKAGSRQRPLPDPAYTRGKLTEEHRAKLAKSNILNALIEHVQGKREMSATQVSAGIALLRKIMPDLSSQALTDEAGGPLSVSVKQYVVQAIEPASISEPETAKDSVTTH